jgi:hypothetical protein
VLVIPAVWRLREENQEFEASLGSILRLYLKNEKQKLKHMINLANAPNCVTKWCKISLLMPSTI